MRCHNAPTLSRLNTSSHLSRNKAGTLVTRGVWRCRAAGVLPLPSLPPDLQPALPLICPLPSAPCRTLRSRGHAVVWGTRCEESLHAGDPELLMSLRAHGSSTVVSYFACASGSCCSAAVGSGWLSLSPLVFAFLDSGAPRFHFLPVVPPGGRFAPCRAHTDSSSTTHDASRESGRHAPLHAYCARAYHRR